MKILILSRVVAFHSQQRNSKRFWGQPIKVATPLHKLTRKDQHLPIRSKWIQESNYDIAYHHIKSMILDGPLYLWTKDNKKHLYLEVDDSDDGWGACAYQFAMDHPIDAEAGKANMFSKNPKRIINWISKVWITYDVLLIVPPRSKVFRFSIKKLLLIVLQGY
jgi:hypothetical protein